MPQYSARLRLNATNNPGQAKWCDDHARLECTGNRSRGRGPCHGPAVRGTPNCKTHAGMKREVAIARGQARITAWNAFGDISKAVDHKMAVLGVLQMSWLRLAAYSELLRKQVEKDGKILQAQGIDEADILPDSSGLIGFKYGAAGKDGTIYAVSEEARSLVLLEAAERDRVVKYAKTAHDMGISDRLTGLAERWGDMVATKITLMMHELGLSPEQEVQLPRLIQAHLGQIDMGHFGDGD